MKGAVVHGALLAVMLVYGYRTWTREKSSEPNLGNVTMWDKAEADLTSIEYKSDKRIVRIERRGDGGDSYWWGVDTTIEKKAKPPTPPANQGSGSGSGNGSAAKGSGSGSGSAGSGSGSAAAGSGSNNAGSGSGSAAHPAAGSGSGSATAGSGSAIAGSGSAAQPAAGSGSGSAGSGSGTPIKSPPTPVAEEETRKTREFPLGEGGDKAIKAWVSAKALRELGVVTDDKKKEYKFDDSKATITITFKDGPHTFQVSSQTNTDWRNLLEPSTGKGYVVAKDMLYGFEIGETQLHLVEPRGFEVAKIGQVTIEGMGKSKTVARVTSTDDKGKEMKVWGDPDTKKADQTAANFVENANNLKPSEYNVSLKIESLTPVLKLTYKEERGALLGTLSLYKREKPGELGPDQELDPANPPKGEIEYYVVTEKTRVPGLVRKDTAQREEQDLEAVFSDKPPEAPAPPGGKIDPKNPLAPKGPLKPLPKPPNPHAPVPGGSGAP
jgi:hypothetical protein